MEMRADPPAGKENVRPFSLSHGRITIHCWIFNLRIDMVDMKPCFAAYLEIPHKIKLELAVVIRLVLTGALDRDLLVCNRRIISRSVNSPLEARLRADRRHSQSASHHTPGKPRRYSARFCYYYSGNLITQRISRCSPSPVDTNRDLFLTGSIFKGVVRNAAETNHEGHSL